MSEMSARSTSDGMVGKSVGEKGLPLLMRAPVDLRKFAIVRSPLSEPRRDMGLWSLETGERNSLHSSV